MLSLNSVSAWIEVDGKEIEQYGIEVDLDHNQVTCWIATQTDKGFSVAFRDNTEYREHSLCSRILLDGSFISGKVLHPSTRIATSQNFATVRTVLQDSQVVTATSSRPFLFSKLELTDEDEYLNQASTKLGEIQIHIHRVQVLGTSLYQPVLNAIAHAKVHERSKKAVTHCVSYGQEVETPTKYGCHVRHLDGNIPLVTFIFKYRDLGLLQANGIIPKPPPVKKKATVSGDVLDLTIENDVKPEPVATQSQKRSTVLAKRSGSSRGNEAKLAKRIKRENNFVSTSEIIDLT